MEEKKKTKSKKKEESQLLLFLLLGLAVVALLVLMICTKLVPQKDFFEVKDRAAKVADTSVVYNNVEYKAVGWIRVQGTNIDYPIITDEDNNGYPVEKDHYAWLTNYDPSFGNHMSISGHNIFNLSAHPERENELFIRFEELMNFIYYDFAQENKYIQLSFDGKEYVYKIFGVGLIPVDQVGKFSLTYDFNEEDTEKFLENFKEFNLYDYKIDVNKNDKLISLITCTRFYGTEEEHQFRVVGRLVREGEKYDNYSVKKAKNYKEVEEILKGDENEDEDI